MKKYYIIFLITLVFVWGTYELMFHMPSVDLLPGKYHLRKQESGHLFTHKLTVYKINKPVDLEKLNSFPKSRELERKGYKYVKWKKFDSKTDDILPFIQDYLIANCTCEEKTTALNLLEQLIKENGNFLYSDIGLTIFNSDKIDASYFFFINEDTNTLYALELLPNM